MDEVSGADKRISRKSVEEAIADTTIEDFNSATRDLKALAREKEEDRSTPDAEI